MAKAITTIRQSLNYQSQHADYLAANHALFNRVVAFYFEVIQAHEKVLDLPTKEALTALEMLTHATSKNRAPVMPLTEIAQDIPVMFRRAAINAALGSARSFYSSLKNHSRKSLLLLCDVQGGSRKTQVLFSPKTPNAKVGHLPTTHGMETATGMAPPKREGVGWERPPQLFLTNSACHWSRGHALCLRSATT